MNSEEIRRPAAMQAAVSACIADALRRLGGEDNVRVADLRLYSWTQVWPSTALGFDTPGGSAMTTALTVVVHDAGRAVVYHGGRWAYEAPLISVLDGIERQRLPGQAQQRADQQDVGFMRQAGAVAGAYGITGLTQILEVDPEQAEQVAAGQAGSTPEQRARVAALHEQLERLKTYPRGYHLYGPAGELGGDSPLHALSEGRAAEVYAYLDGLQATAGE